VGRLRRGEVEGRKKWTPRSCNYLLHLATAVLDDQVKQGNIVRNVARLVDRVAAAPSKYRTLSADEMFAILDHDCRDRHLWALALYGLRLVPTTQPNRRRTSAVPYPCASHTKTARLTGIRGNRHGL
jgi:hypothetical protein